MANFSVWQLDDVAFSGDPFALNALANVGAIGSTFVIGDGSHPVQVVASDINSYFDEVALLQTLGAPVDINGSHYGTGTLIVNEYSYIIRPEGSSDPADNITIYAVDFTGLSVQGFAADARLFPGVTYEIISIDDHSPSVRYSDLFVCFRQGTRIRTQRGDRRVEDLMPGDLVWTMDSGFQPLQWRGQSMVSGLNGMAPVRFDTGVVGNSRPLFVSPQHRMLWQDNAQQEVLVAAKALVGLPGISRKPVPKIGYVHLMFDAHQLVCTDGVISESFNPGAQALANLDSRQRAQVISLVGDHVLKSGRSAFEFARRVIRPGVWRREMQAA